MGPWTVIFGVADVVGGIFHLAMNFSAPTGNFNINIYIDRISCWRPRMHFSPCFTYVLFILKFGPNNNYRMFTFGSFTRTPFPAG
jgi:hypothetical protein